MTKCINVNEIIIKGTCIKNKNNGNTPPSLSPIMNRSCQTLFLLFMHLIAIARLSHGLDSVERESSVGAFLLRLRLLTSLSISHSQSLSGLCSPCLILPLYTHSSCTWYVLRTESAGIVSVNPYRTASRRQKGVPIITTGSPKSREYGDPGMPIFTGCVNFYDTGPRRGVSFQATIHSNESCIIALESGWRRLR